MEITQQKNEYQEERKLKMENRLKNIVEQFKNKNNIKGEISIEKNPRYGFAVCVIRSSTSPGMTAYWNHDTMSFYVEYPHETKDIFPRLSPKPFIQISSEKKDERIIKELEKRFMPGLQEANVFYDNWKDENKRDKTKINYLKKIIMNTIGNLSSEQEENKIKTTWGSENCRAEFDINPEKLKIELELPHFEAYFFLKHFEKFIYAYKLFRGDKK